MGKRRYTEVALAINRLVTSNFDIPTPSSRGNLFSVKPSLPMKRSHLSILFPDRPESIFQRAYASPLPSQWDLSSVQEARKLPVSSTFVKQWSEYAIMNCYNWNESEWPLGTTPLSHQWGYSRIEKSIDLERSVLSRSNETEFSDYLVFGWKIWVFQVCRGLFKIIY